MAPLALSFKTFQISRNEVSSPSASADKVEFPPSPPKSHLTFHERRVKSQKKDLNNSSLALQ